MIEQMIMIGFEGRSEREPDVVAAHDQLAQGVIGGVVLYPDNRFAGATPRAHDLFARCQVVADPVHRRRSGRDWCSA